ncbi:hypothetical protein BGW38_010769 [Lunasporangiospora selenospora]|uniref:Xanthine/uracil permease n=1 Tax=Lunasporangiospora selenospora TaxID=979761 RepID=A0A9P6KFA7_9FUNG|nr:hypothetical protein BGW38_010769 [Lunasporangiospora selenospora]
MAQQQPSSGQEIVQAPEPVPSPVYILDPHANRVREEDIDLSHTVGKFPTWQTVREALGSRSGWLGDYDYGFLCMPTLPGFTVPKIPPFFGLKDRLPLVLAIIMGFQHALAMIAGVVTPAIIMSGSGVNGLNFPPAMRTQMVSTSLITSGLLSLVQITRFRLFRSNYFLGTGLLSVVGTSFIFLPVLQSSVADMYASGFCTSSKDASGFTTYDPCPQAWGAFLGTCMMCSFLPICLSFLPPKVLKKVFPPIVTGVTVLLIGVHLVDSVVIGLVVGMIVAITLGYTDSSSVDASPTVTFLWVKTYKYGIYPPAIIPLLITYTLAMVESIGDITASCEVSHQPVEGRAFESRLQGGILADGIAGTLAPLFFNSPMSCYAQNNGIISLTRCANTMAGYMCCFFLVLMGVFSKFGALFLMLPDAVLGGMTTFLFASVVVSGVRILSFLKWTRRERFIVATALTLGLGTSLVHGVFTKMFHYNGDNSFVKSLISSANIVLDTGFALGAIVSCLLNALLPEVAPMAAEPIIDRHGPNPTNKEIEDMQVEAQSIHESMLSVKH